MLLVFLSLSLSGIFHEMIDHELFEKIHPIMGYTLTGLVLIHLILNREWIARVLFKKKA